MNALSSILVWLNRFVLETANVIAVQVESATDMNADQKAKVERRFQSLLGKGVEASYRIDPKLIGGVRVTANGKTYDGSIAGWLSSFEEQLVQGVI